MKTVSLNRSHGGVQGVYTHTSSACNCDMTFSVFSPPQADTQSCPVLYYLSGLTCTHANVTEKGEFRQMAAELGLIIVCPDTSPRGHNVPDDDQYYFGQAAGYYLDATEAPYATHYNMYSYVTGELPEIVSQNFNADMDRQSVFGHSMGGHGAMVLALRNPGKYKSVSAFAPMCAPSQIEWGEYAFSRFLGTNRETWQAYDTVALINGGSRLPELLVDVGTADQFLESGIRPDLLGKACDETGIDLTLRMHDGYDHSYYFISTFMNDHLAWHAQRLGLTD